MNWNLVTGRLRLGQRQIGAVFGVGMAVLLALIARQSWLAQHEPPRHTPTPVYAVAAPAANTPTPSATPTQTPTPQPTWTPEPTPTPSPTATLAPTGTPEPTETPWPTATPEPTATPRPMPTPDGVARTVQVPILMYHYISQPPAGANAVRRDLSVPPDVFEQHLAFLQQRGYTSISLGDLVMALQIGQPLPEKPIVLTFDDGYRDHYEHAYPLLQAYGLTGTFFLLTAPIDQGHPGYVTWEQVIEMDAAGMEMEAHGYTHDDLKGRSREYLIWQMLGSKEAIEARTGKPVRIFCYPSGSYDALAISILHELDYWAAVTIHFGREHRSDRPFELTRLRIHGNYGVAQLGALLSEPVPGSGQ
jgi:peptidoglycan/xylan/chitin deacetylase (PgdA/CDA1 family)